MARYRSAINQLLQNSTDSIVKLIMRRTQASNYILDLITSTKVC
jgi:hypothetical protein